MGTTEEHEESNDPRIIENHQYRRFHILEFIQNGGFQPVMGVPLYRWMVLFLMERVAKMDDLGVISNDFGHLPMI